jgi:aspartyl protease family protein
MAAELALSGIVGERALLVLDHGPPQLVAVGKSTATGIRLISLQGDRAVVEFEGHRQTLRLGERVVRQTGSAKGNSGVGVMSSDEARKVLSRGVEITLIADAQGHFFANGEINGSSAHFLVDTGATRVAIGRSTARTMGLYMDDARKTRAHTAAGVTTTWHVTLKSVKIEGMRFERVEAAIMDADMPYVLLGMSLLGQMEMRRDGNQMRLKKKL